MPRDKDIDSASSASGQSTSRPPINRHQSDVSETHRRPKQYQKQHHAGRLHARVPSSKTLHKQHQHGHPHTHGGVHHAQHAHQGQAQPAAAAKSNSSSHSNARRPAVSPLAPDLMQQLQQAQQAKNPQQTYHSYRRATSDLKLSRPSSSTDINVQNISSQSSIKRNKSHSEIHKRTKSSDKLKRLSGGNRPKSSSKSQVHFDLGNETQDDAQDDEDEWIDASGSNSPHLSRKGSIASTPQSSLRPVDNSRPITPNTPAQPLSPAQSDMLTPERERVHQKEYLTTRLLRRTPSHGAPPQMTTETALVNPPNFSPDMSGRDSAPSLPATLVGSNGMGVTSRFVDTPASAGNASDGSFYHRLPAHDEDPIEEIARRPKSMANLSRSHEATEAACLDKDDSALVPKIARRIVGKPAETSRIQQKLNLQRASSAIEPGHSMPRNTGNRGTSPLIGVKGPGFDGANSRDPRMGKLLERTGMEYLVVRRYQNPIARSLTRIGAVPDIDKPRRIPRINTGSTNSKRSLDLHIRHQRNINMPDSRRPVTPRTTATSIRTNGAGSSFEDDSRLEERLSGSSLVGMDEDDETTALLRNLWEKSTDLNASAN